MYIEGSPAEYVYVIYQGECNLLKSNVKINPSEKLIHFKSQMRLLTLLKGDFAGFEALKKNQVYHSTLVVS